MKQGYDYNGLTLRLKNTLCDYVSAIGFHAHPKLCVCLWFFPWVINKKSL